MDKNNSVWIPAGEFGEIVDELVKKEGGYFNAHAHVDRGCTLDSKYLEHYGITPLQAASAPLSVKQNLTGELHRGKAYQDSEDLVNRMEFQLVSMIRDGVRRVVSFIDATPDIGLTAINAAIALSDQYCDKINFEIAAHPIFGFKEDLKYSISRLELFEQACRKADIVGALPEKDDRPDSVGQDAHIKHVLRIGGELGKPVHIHTGQANSPKQKQIFDVIEAIRWLGSPKVSCVPEGEPTVWVIHEISSACYEESEFRQVLDGLKKYNIGVVVCTSAATSMRQKRALKVPIHNSIARFLEMAYHGIEVRLGTDNINDMYVPAMPPNLLFDVLNIANVGRFNDPVVLAKFAAGKPINESDRERIRLHLKEEERANREEDSNFKLCVDLD